MHKKNTLSHVKVFPFNADNLTYVYSGRNALWHGMNILGLSSGSEVMVPSYNCGAEIDPFVKFGIKVKLYRIDSQLRIDFEDLNKNIDQKTKALLVTHYFGFPQPIDQIKTICDEKGLFLIEDCAHALFSTYKDKPLGSFGDISIFSLRKTLPVPDGGVLVLNNSALKQPEISLQPPLIYMLHNAIIGPLFGFRSLAKVLRMVSSLLQRTKLYKNDSSALYDYRMNLKRVNWGMSKVSNCYIKKIIKKESAETIIERRRHNFVLFLHTFKNETNINTLFTELTEGVCPTLFPVIVRDRDRIHEILLNKGIFTFKSWQNYYPELPWEQFPDAVFLKNHVISFPIHRTINENDILQIVKIFQKNV